MTTYQDCSFPSPGGVSPVSNLSGFSEADLYPSHPPSTPPSVARTKSRKTPPTAERSQTTPQKEVPSHLQAGGAADGGSGDMGSPNSVQNSDIPSANSMHSRSHSTSDLFITPTSSPRLTPPPSCRPAIIGERVLAEDC